MSAFGDGSGPENLRNTGRAPIYIYREFIPAQGLAQSGILYPSSSPEYIQPTTTPPGTSLPNDPAALKSIINTLQTELNATTSVNTHLAASTARLQAELNATTNVNAHLAAAVARFQVEQSLPTPTNTTTTTTTSPLPGSHRDHPRTIASGRGAASPEVFEEIIKTNWHGRLGRTHMVDVDNLPASALAELDCLLRRKLNTIFPRGGAFVSPDVDAIFGGLAALGLRLEDRGAYADVPVVHDNTLHDQSTVRRVKNFATHYYGNNYWRGSVLETLWEVARYRGLIDDEGFLKG